MDNPWMRIPLRDYEQHMAHPAVAQDVLLADVLENAVRKYTPLSLAVIGCAGGNGFDRLTGNSIERVVAVDINPEYVGVVRERFGATVQGLHVIVGDIQNDALTFAPVDLIMAGLLFEYVDLRQTLLRVHALLRPGSILVSLIQLPAAQPEITPTPFTALSQLDGSMHLVSPEELIRTAGHCGFSEITSSLQKTASGKSFLLQEFRKMGEDM